MVAAAHNNTRRNISYAKNNIKFYVKVFHTISKCLTTILLFVGLKLFRSMFHFIMAKSTWRPSFVNCFGGQTVELLCERKRHNFRKLHQEKNHSKNFFSHVQPILETDGFPLKLFKWRLMRHSKYTRYKSSYVPMMKQVKKRGNIEIIISFEYQNSPCQDKWSHRITTSTGLLLISIRIKLNDFVLVVCRARNIISVKSSSLKKSNLQFPLVRYSSFHITYYEFSNSCF